MADNERIVVWLRLRDTMRFRRDARRAADAIKEIGQAAEESGSPLSQMGGFLSGLIGKIPQATGRTRIFGFAVGTVVTAFVALIPLVVGLGGAVVALAGSLGAAALGAGALGVAIAGAAIPLGALGLVAADVFMGFQKVNTAFQRWQVAVGTYGQNSKQAETALARLESIANTLGGRSLITLAQSWDSFLKAFRKENAGAISDIAQILTVLLQIATQLLPVFSTIAKQAGGALLDAFKNLGDELTSEGFQNTLLEMGNVFASLAGPLGRSVINIFMGLFAIAARLAPTVHWLFTELELASMAFRSWAESGSLGGIVSQFKSWWNLIKAVGGLLITLLSGGASEGQGMVDTLTALVNKWNAWLNTAQGQKSLISFFHDAAEMTKAFAVVIGYITVGFFKFGRAMLPIYTTVFKAIVSAGGQLKDAFAPMAPFLNNILIPLLKGLAEGVIGALVGSFKTLVVIIKIVSEVLGFIGKVVGPSFKGTFELIGKVIGFLLGGPILKLLSKIGEINILLRPLGFLFRALAIPIELAGAVVGKFIGWLGRLIGAGASLASRFFSPLRGAISSVLEFFTSAGSRFYNAGVYLWRRLEKGITQAIGSGLGFAADIGKAVYNWVARQINRALPNSLGPINIPNNPIPMLAGGGVVSGSGSWITGEAGPEINTLRDGKVSVVPLTPAVKAQGTSATLSPREGKRTIVTKVYLKGRQIAEAVADEVSDENARR